LYLEDTRFRVLFGVGCSLSNEQLLEHLGGNVQLLNFVMRSVVVLTLSVIMQ